MNLLAAPSSPSARPRPLSRLATSLAVSLGLAAGLPGLAAADALEVDVSPALALDADQVKAAIEAELGATVVDDPTAADLGSVSLRLDRAKRLTVSHRRPDGTLLVRVVKLPPLPADQLAVIAFVTGNLVRDQLADLAAPDAPTAAAPPAVVQAPTAVQAPAVVQAPAAVQAPGAVQDPAAVPAPAAVQAPDVVQAAAVAPPPAPEAPEVTVPLSIGIVPPLSTDRLFAPRTRVRGALNVVVGASSSIDGISISGAVDLSANVRGLQIGGAATLARDLRGSQLAGAIAVAHDGVGLQIAGAATVARDLRGIQLAGAGAVARDVRGLQVAGAATLARDLTGLQIAGGAAVAGQIDGAQVSSINVASTLHGLQLGAINVAGSAHGLQLGAINIASDSDGAQIGALNFVRNGRTDLDAWVETSGLGALALRHGGRYVHNVYAVGFTPDGGDTPILGLGLGTHHRLGGDGNAQSLTSYFGRGGAVLDLDAMAWQTHLFADGVGLLAQARATLAIDLGPVAAFVAAAYNVSIEDRGEDHPFKTTLARTIGEPMSSVDVALWPSLSAGVRGHLGRAR